MLTDSVKSKELFVTDVSSYFFMFELFQNILSRKFDIDTIINFKTFMKKIVFAGIFVSLLSGTQSFGQTINLSTDSITTLLCKKWEVDYSIMGDMKIGRMPGATEINFEFNKDKTFFLTSNDPNDKTKGTWTYDAKKKIIKLTINGRSKASIISLKNEELIILADTKDIAPDDPTDIKVVYKIKKDNKNFNYEFLFCDIRGIC